MPPESAPALVAWKMMGGAMDWQALPMVVELIGVKDVELLVIQLLTIREFTNRG